MLPVERSTFGRIYSSRATGTSHPPLVALDRIRAGVPAPIPGCRVESLVVTPELIAVACLELRFDVGFVKIPRSSQSILLVEGDSTGGSPSRQTVARYPNPLCTGPTPPSPSSRRPALSVHPQ